MPKIETKYFGVIEFEESSVFHFRRGLPGFEEEKCFVPMEAPGYSPLVFLQSVAQKELCFLASAVQVVHPDYHLSVTAEDLAAIGLDDGRKIQIGRDVLALTLLCVRDGSPVTANLMAPIVVNLHTRDALQAVRHDSLYSHEYPVTALSKAESC